MSNYFYQTRNGVRVRVRKGRNRVRFHKGKKITRASVRGAIPTKKGEVYGKGAIVINDKSDSIKRNDGVSLRRKGGVVVAAGKLGKVKAGVAGGYKRGRKIDAIADYSNGSNTAEFGAYYTRVRRGKKERVRKSRPSILGRALGRNRTMYTSRELNDDLAKELAKEMKANPPKTLKEKLIGKRYPKAERRAIARYKRKYKSFGAEFPTLAEFAESSTHYKRRSKKGKVSLVKKGRRKGLKKLILGTAALAGGGYLAHKGLTYGLMKAAHMHGNKFRRPGTPIVDKAAHMHGNKFRRPGTPIVDDIDKYFG